jgi:glucose/mannose-6-phosphate isomerase
MIVNRNYTLPNFINEHSLVFASSYSGNTEETLHAFQLAQASGARIIGISSNGDLSEILHKENIPLIRIPGGMQPRAALGFSFIPVARMLKKLGLVERELRSEIEETIQKVSELGKRYQQEDDSNLAFKLAQPVLGSVPIFYTAPELRVIGIRWKGQMAENAQILALTNELPEMNHNEIMGWGESSQFLQKSEVFWMVDEATHSQVRKRIEVTAELLENFTQGMYRISTEGKSWMTRLFSLIYLGDWVSLYAALLQGVDPAKIKNISLLKKRLL